MIPTAPLASGTAYDILASAAASVGVSITWNYLGYNRLDNSMKSLSPVMPLQG